MKDYKLLPNGEWVKVIDNEVKDFCVVCGSVDHIENHHWAPSHLFGEYKDKWPTSKLCRSCHIHWHNIVTPDMSKRKTHEIQKRKASKIPRKQTLQCV